jgi:hypothetical protein
MFVRYLNAIALVAAMAAPAFAEEPLIAFDVAEDQTRFSYAPAPVFDDGMPSYGNPFISQGYIYPAGTLAGGATGVLENGDPAWPDKVLGTWTCDGWFVGEAMHGTTGTILISRQVFQFVNGSVLVTQGPEIADQNTPFHRVIAGGTGDYAETDGVIEQTLLGFTEHMGAILTFTLPDTEPDA